jgi:hypothetical protein
MALAALRKDVQVGGRGPDNCNQLIGMCSCSWSLVLLVVTGPAHGHWSCSWSLVLLMVTGPARGHWSCSWSLVLLVVTGPARGHWSCSWSLVLLVVTGPARGHWSCSWSLVLLVVTGPAHGHWSCSWSLVLLVVTGPARGHWSCSWSLVAVAVAVVQSPRETESREVRGLVNGWMTPLTLWWPQLPRNLRPSSWGFELQPGARSLGMRTKRTTGPCCPSPVLPRSARMSVIGGRHRRW